MGHGEDRDQWMVCVSAHEHFALLGKGVQTVLLPLLLLLLPRAREGLLLGASWSLLRFEVQAQGW